QTHMREGRMTQAIALAERTGIDLDARELAMPEIEDPLFPRLVCYRVWSAAGDARAPGALEAAYRELNKLAERSGDEDTRRSILENVPVHREIVAARNDAA